MCEEITGRTLEWDIVDDARLGDHRWWVSDLASFKLDYPDWSLEYDVEAMLREIHEHNVDRWVHA